MSRDGNLPMLHFLKTVALYGVNAKEVLLDCGFHHKVILAKAMKASDKGYTEYGVVEDRPWLTDEGRQFIAARQSPDP